MLYTHAVADSLASSSLQECGAKPVPSLGSLGTHVVATGHEVIAEVAADKARTACH